jgi:multidrug resistance efflux pump
MKSHEPIPIPSSMRWREFRQRYVPILTFIAAIGGAAVTWKNYVVQETMQGVGEGVRSFIAAPQVVRVQKWLVEPHTMVAAGTPLVIVSPVDARTDYDRLRSLFEMARIHAQPSLAEDNAMNFERIRVELLRTKSELAIARVKLEQAERDVTRNTPLFREKLVPEDIYELSVNTRDALKAEVEEKSKAVAQIEQRFEQLRPIGEPDPLRDESATGEWFNRLEAAQAAAAKNMEPLTLVSPITGMVGLPQRQAGEFVPAGELLLTVNSLRSDRVIAYLRQPYRVDPKVGMTARVTTRTYKRQVFTSQVVQVGAHMEVLTNSLAFLRPGYMVDAGLPIVVQVPKDIHIRPGEVVDVLLTEASAGTPAPTPSAASPNSQPQL